MKRFVTYYVSWVPAAAWVGLTYVLLTMEVNPESVSWLPPYADKVVHAGLFGLLAWLLLLPLRVSTGLTVWSATFVAIVVSSTYGVFTEYLQSQIPYRTADLGDVIANVTGALSALLYPLYVRKKQV